MMQQIRHLDSDREFYIEERCHIIELSNSADDPDCSIARARVEPGVTTCWHRLSETAERYLIVSGAGRVEIGELPAATVQPGDLVTIPPMTPQRITNTSSEDLIFYAICTPRFLPENYQPLESAE
ncbi:MAG: cupin domain-containing protein [Candidatus Thiodiazotropha lotti]|uniref:Cupin n=1 Tax=Candidatus Thiodiazotropha endoloripes TaxID=1818881 RepID=A0A1E2UNH1_9GAMM|nr:cupin domain-containing protein [Candidatus Thiodiazotropha endoloripes]MCG7900384.1 cupin domain-containing protein [Candidatus Thiodiazotropha weberae]MCG7991214.1 cupin domain-containing protein [Candidatus Thiodiazotropha lotti]MCG7903208.1 cupin domain-containing protein [Candidatus Thiodiazotropha weberae]MCG7915169.1 cupin domain-containing protein [Candidatus Thiodiazotropha weberae]MCG7998240.1 cupin domain-containing protein [Candidatus Thiodiazotropha lotti]